MSFRFCTRASSSRFAGAPLAALSFLLLFSSAFVAASPSYVPLWIDPVAVNPSGQVLLRTFYRSNLSSGMPQDGSEIRFARLAVSTQGLWKEYGHFSVKEAEGAAGDKGRKALFDRHMNEFEAPFDWNSPPASVQPILKTYKFSKSHTVYPRLGKGEVTWTPKGIYAKMKRLERDASQLTLGRKSFLRGAGSEIEAAFFSRAVALFRNEGKPEMERGNRGAKGTAFIPAGPATGGKSFSVRDAGVDVWEVDGIGLLKSKQTSHKKARKKPQRSKAKTR